MSASDPKQMPALWRPPQGGSDIEHHTQEWTSGSMGGGKVPADFEWTSNPRAYAEEFGANLPPGVVPQIPTVEKSMPVGGQIPAAAQPTAVSGTK